MAQSSVWRHLRQLQGMALRRISETSSWRRRNYYNIRSKRHAFWKLVFTLRAENQRLRDSQEGNAACKSNSAADKLCKLRTDESVSRPSGEKQGVASVSASAGTNSTWSKSRPTSMACNRDMSKRSRGRSLKEQQQEKQHSRGFVGFCDEEDMKRRVRAIVERGQEGVNRLYHEQGFFPWIARSRYFDYSTTLHIFLNSVWLWIDADYGDATSVREKTVPFQIVEHYFCMYFVF